MEDLEPVELKSITLHTVTGDENEEQGRKEGDLQKVTKTNLNQVKKRRKEIRNRHSHPNSGKTRMFGVKFDFGTDDFFFLALFAVVLRAAW